MPTINHKCQCGHSWSRTIGDRELFNPWGTCANCEKRVPPAAEEGEHGGSFCIECGVRNPPPMVTELGWLCAPCYGKIKAKSPDGPVDTLPD